jgi:hypothetical protein
MSSKLSEVVVLGQKTKLLLEMYVGTVTSSKGKRKVKIFFSTKEKL